MTEVVEKVKDAIKLAVVVAVLMGIAISLVLTGLAWLLTNWWVSR